MVLEYDSQPAKVEFADPNHTPSREDGEVEIQRTIYEYSFKKVQKRFTRKGPTILSRYVDIMKALEAKVDSEDIHLLDLTRKALKIIQKCLENEKPDVSGLI